MAEIDGKAQEEPELSEGEDAIESFEDQIGKEVVGLKNRGVKPFLAIDASGLQCTVFLRAIKGQDVIKTVDRLFRLIAERSIKSIKY